MTERLVDLGGHEAGTRGRPVFGRELEVPSLGPVGHHTNDVGEVGLGVELVQLARGDEGEDVRGRVGVIVASEADPILSRPETRA